MTAAEFKASILDQAIRGKLVPQDPGDEPAAELLKRIKAEKAKHTTNGRGRAPTAPSPITDDEKFLDVPVGWEWIRLGDLYRFIDYRGKTPTKIATGIPLVTAKNVRPGYMDYSIKEFISPEEFLMRQSRGIAEKGDILFTTEAPLGFVAIADLDCFSTGQRLIALHDDSYLMCNSLVMWFVLSDVWQEYMKRMKTGTTVAGIKAEKLKQIPIPLPPLAEQNRIVEKIEELLPLVERYGKAEERRAKLNAALPADLEKSILQEAIQGSLTAKWSEENKVDEPAAELLKRIKAEKAKLIAAKKIKKEKPLDPITDDEKPFEIPESWVWCRLGELGVFFGGHTPSMADSSLWGEEYLWISSKDMKTKYITDTGDKLTKKGCDELRLLPVDTMVFTTRSGILKHTFPVAILKRESTINQDQKALVLYCPEIVEYIYLAIKGQESRIIQYFTKRGTTVQSILWDEFVSIPIPLPPLAEQKTIVKRVEELFAVLDAMKEV